MDQTLHFNNKNLPNLSESNIGFIKSMENKNISIDTD